MSAGSCWPPPPPLPPPPPPPPMPPRRCVHATAAECVRGGTSDARTECVPRGSAVGSYDTTSGTACGASGLGVRSAARKPLEERPMCVAGTNVVPSRKPSRPSSLSRSCAHVRNVLRWPPAAITLALCT
eukprot:3835987-Prymnesium_polylepis.1